MSHNLPDYNLEPPEPNERSDYVVGLLQDEFDTIFISEIFYESMSDEFQERLLRLAKGIESTRDKDDIKNEIVITYESKFEQYVDANYYRLVESLNDPY